MALDLPAEALDAVAEGLGAGRAVDAAGLRAGEGSATAGAADMARRRDNAEDRRGLALLAGAVRLVSAVRLPSAERFAAARRKLSIDFQGHFTER